MRRLFCVFKLQAVSFLNTCYKYIIYIYPLTIKDIVVSGSQDNIVRIWDLLSLRNLSLLRGHTAPVTCLQVLLNNFIDFIICE